MVIIVLITIEIAVMMIIESKNSYDDSLSNQRKWLIDDSMRIIMIIFLVTMIVSNSNKHIYKNIHKNNDAKISNDFTYE